MMSPRRTKFRKVQKGRTKGNTTRCNTLEYGTCGLKALTPARTSARQLESGRVAINRTFKRAGKMAIRVFPDLPVSKKPAEVRMGSGKGSPEYWAARTYPGQIVYEVGGLDETLMKDALRKAGCRMPFRWKIVTNDKMLAGYAKQVHTLDQQNATYIKNKAYNA